MTDFLWHKVSEKEKEKITKQAKQIMDDFSKKLSGVDKLKEPEIIRDVCERKEGSEESLEIDRKIMFDNAPSKNNTLKGTSDFIVAEKKKW